MIALLSIAEAQAALPDLTDILHDSIAGGSSVGFIQPFGPPQAEAFWRKILAAQQRGELLMFGARNASGRLDGVVLLGIDTPQNQPHRAEVKKLLVHSRARRQGLARKLMLALEQEAARLNRRLLVLDTRQGDPSEHLYRSLGYQLLGVLPGYAMPPSGAAPEDCSFYYKKLH